MTFGFSEYFTPGPLVAAQDATEDEEAIEDSVVEDDDDDEAEVEEDETTDLVSVHTAWQLALLSWTILAREILS